ncbi:hypothetical protein niasHT_035028 [Heterodera trifolii]|uniref:RRM domain-containing protein n=1 Tax=Heterodera trifolii TaxID=157864 RepID=A0ABD2IQ98_9BILA
MFQNRSFFTATFIFCLVVLSPCRITANTQRSSISLPLEIDANAGFSEFFCSMFVLLKAFNVLMEPNSVMSKGYDFCEYLNQSLTDQALVDLKGTLLGDSRMLIKLTAARARKFDTHARNAVQNTGIDLSRGAEPPTEVLCLMNMVTKEELQQDEVYEDIKKGIRIECNKFGNVVSMEIPRPGYDERGVGKIFVEFQSKDECQKAQAALTGLKFGGRLVATSYFDPDLYHRRQF